MASHSFSQNYLVLRPEEVSLWHLFRFSLNDDLAQKTFIEYPTGKEENLQRRWLIFMSLFGQKVLQHLAKPMASFGSAFEMSMNLMSCNGNFFRLLLHVLQNKVIVPERTSENFLSFVGHLDERQQLDKNINHGDRRYYAMICAMASKLSYENKAVVESTVRNCWKMEFLGYHEFWNDFQRKFTTRGFIFHDKIADPDVVFVAFRGTEPFDLVGWCTDIDISWYELPGVGKVHRGFMKALGLLVNQGWRKEIDPQETDKYQVAYYIIREKLKILLNENSRTKFILTGHSSGGALAILFPAILALHEETLLLKRLEGVYTFGQPRVGDVEFKTFMKKQMDKYDFKYLRFVYSNDIIPRLPSDDSKFLFKHFGTCLYYNGFYQGKIVEEQPDKNFISKLATIPRILIAFWELLRSFILPYKEGPDYHESWWLKLLRFVGLALPGLAAHNPHDYVNLSRLGSASIYDKLQDQHSEESQV